MTLSQQAILEKYNPWFMMCFDRPPIPGAAEFARRIHELAPRAGDRYIEKLVNDALEWSKPIRDRELLENRAILVAYGNEEIWFPISQIEFDESAIMTDEVTTIKLPR